MKKIIIAVLLLLQTGTVFAYTNDVIEDYKRECAEKLAAMKIANEKSNEDLKKYMEYNYEYKRNKYINEGERADDAAYDAWYGTDGCPHPSRLNKY